ncbi:MAG TPA: hypothetical protein PKC99_18980 [Anaerolineales bacterium]|nr:hypothetical protein [Chloroflexota bacterium]MCL4825231.1 hypothetical protein [Anaerolineales bacterium]NOG76755.1 hypothetical protein [Chloroflexota bacterium]WKZ52337.1 MAG: hypothetical protein QY329_06285 [Anaerolineales bacterium]HMN01092.1 hypothetical protein [Anaerolineales bacterium]
MKFRASSAPAEPVHRNSGRLIVICGLPGSGKTTLAKCLEESLGSVRPSPDE